MNDEHATCNVLKTLHVARPSYSALSISTLAKFLLKRHTRFAYVVLLRASRRFGEPAASVVRICGSSLPAHYATEVKGSGCDSNDNLGQTVFVTSAFSPVTDAIGRIRRCQRSTCVAAALPAPMRGKEKSICEGITPRTVEMIPHPPPLRQSPRPPKLARAPCGQNHEFAANASIKCNGPLPSLFQSTLRLG